MRISIGKKFKNRYGHTVEVIEQYEDGIYVWGVKNVESGQEYGATASGRYWGDNEESGYDLVEEIYPEPNTTPIDQVSIKQLERGVARLWDIGKIW